MRALPLVLLLLILSQAVCSITLKSYYTKKKHVTTEKLPETITLPMRTVQPQFRPQIKISRYQQEVEGFAWEMVKQKLKYP